MKRNFLNFVAISLALVISLAPLQRGSLASEFSNDFDGSIAAIEEAPSDNQYVVQPRLWEVSVNGTGNDSAILSNSDVEQYCGDGDGCLVLLFLHPSNNTIPTRIEIIRLATNGPGPFFWRIFPPDGGPGLNFGSTDDMTEDTLMEQSTSSGGGTMICALKEGSDRSGSLNSIFELTIGNSGVVPSYCLLRIED